MGEFMKFLPITLMVTLGSSLFVALVINPVLITVFMKLDDSNKERKKFWIIQAVLIALGLLLVITQMGKSVGLTVAGNLLLTLALLSILNVYVLTPVSRKFRMSFLPWLEKLYMSLLTFAFKRKNPYLFFWGTVGL